MNYGSYLPSTCQGESLVKPDQIVSTGTVKRTVVVKIEKQEKIPNEICKKDEKSATEDKEVTKVIFTPIYREVTEQENPLMWDDLTPGATDNATAFILDTHPQLETIEDMNRLGHEKRLNGPHSLLMIFIEHPEYELDKSEAAKIANYTPEQQKTIIAMNWPKRVYDSECTKMTNKLQVQVDQMMEEWKETHEKSVEKASGVLSRSRSPGRRRVGRSMDDMITESSDDDTEGEDFSF